MIKKTYNYLKEDYNRRTFIFSGISILISLVFAIYNGVIGLGNGSLWHTSIFGYYILLMLVKSLLVFAEYFNKKSKKGNNTFIFINISYVLLGIITIAMIAPAIVLINDKRSYDWGLIPAIVMATYTTYNITLAIINIKKVKANDNYMVRQIRLINLITALMSILVLQNTLILANAGYDDGLRLLSIYTSLGIIITIVIIIIISFIKTLKKNTF